VFKKSLNIALTFILLFSITGFTTTISLCCCKKEIAPKTCCEKKKEQSGEKEKCCGSETVLYRLDSDLSLSNPEVNVPDYFSQAIPLFTINEPSQLISDQFSGYHYTSPPGIRDIPVFIQCFRN